MNDEHALQGHGDITAVDESHLVEATLSKAGQTALEIWNTTVRNIIRKAKGLKPEDHVDLPNGETGRYLRLALDKNGNLSTGKRHGRLKARRRPSQVALAMLEQQLFAERLAFFFKRARRIADETKAEIKPINQEQFAAALRYSKEEALLRTLRPIKAARKAARKRQQNSRRVNAGILQTHRSVHSAA